MKDAGSFIVRITKLNSDLSKLTIVYSKINANQTSEILTAAQLKEIYNYILNIPNLLEQLNSLTPNHSYRFLKNKSLRTPLPRTCVIQKYPDGHLELIVMPNSKLATGKKIAPQITPGSFKKFKVAYRIDDALETNIKRARLRVELPPQEAQEEILTTLRVEAQISQKAATSQFICPIFLSSTYKHNVSYKETTAIYAFSKLGKCNLYDLIDSIIQQKTYTPGQPIPQLIINIITGLFTALKHLESCNVIHNDLSLGNIILDTDDAIKIIDFGAAIDLDNYDTQPITKGIAETLSPEKILYYHDEYKDVYGASVAKKHYKKFATADAEQSHKNFHFDLKDDVWSLGIIMISLITLNPAPNNYHYIQFILSKNPLLKALLRPTRSERITATIALERWLADPTLVSVSYTDFSIQYEINTELDRLDSYLNHNWQHAIWLLDQCAIKAKEIKQPDALLTMRYRSPDEYSKAANNLQDIYNQHEASFKTQIEAILLNIKLRDKLDSQPGLKIQLKKNLSTLILHLMPRLAGVDHTELVSKVSTDLSALLMSKRRCTTFLGQLSRYPLTNAEICNTITLALSAIKPIGLNLTVMQLFATSTLSEAQLPATTLTHVLT